MTIKVGDKLPSATFRLVTGDGARPVTTQEFFAGRKIVLFGLPGAFTPTCHKNHLPGFLADEAAFKAKGVAEIAMTAVNDHYVLGRMVEGDRSGRPHRLPRRRRRRLRQGGRARLRRFGGRPRAALEALFDAGRGRRGENPQHRGIAGQGRSFRRGASPRADVSVRRPPLGGRRIDSGQKCPAYPLTARYRM